MSDKLENIISFFVTLIVPFLLLLGIRHSWVFKGVNESFYDTLLNLRGQVPCSTVVIVSIDDSSLIKLGHWPWPRSILAYGLDRIKGEKVIGMDLLFAERTDSYNDNMLLEAIRRHGDVVLPMVSTEKNRIMGSLFPYNLVARSTGHVVLSHSIDGTIRKAYAFISERDSINVPAFSIEIYRIYKGIPLDSVCYNPEKKTYCLGDLKIKLFKDHSFYINYLSQETGFVNVPFYRLFEPGFDPSVFKDKIVLIGLTATGTEQDQFITPLSKNSNPMSGVGVQANIIGMFLKDMVVKPVSETTFLIIAFLLMGIMAWVMEYRNIYVALSGILITMVAAFALSYYLFKEYNILVPYTELFVLGTLTAFVGLIVRFYQLSRKVVRLTYALKDEPIMLPSLEKGKLDGIENGIKKLFGFKNVIIAKECPPGTYKFDVDTGIKLCVEPEPSGQAQKYIQETFIPLIRTYMLSKKGGTLLFGGLDKAVKNLMLAEEKIRTQNKAFNVLLNTVQGGLIITDAFGNIRYLNDRTARALGLSISEAKRMNILDIFENQQHLQTDIDFRRVLTEMKPHAFGEITNKLTGETYGVGASFFTSEEGLSGLTIVLYDITRLKELLEAREFALYGLTHQFSTPVTVIREYARLLKRNPENFNEKFLDAIITSANNLESLINQFVYFSKLDRETASETFTEFDITQVIKREAEEVKKKYPDKELTLELPDSLSAYGNPDMMGVAVNNLIDNALKYSNSRARIRCYRDREDVVIEVCDDGTGIPEDERDSVFDTFRRGRTKRKGFGLGLALVKKIVELHRGKIEVSDCRSELGGAKFVVRLPGNPA